MSNRGRPSKLTDTVKARLVQAITSGNYHDAACTYAGISPRSFYYWLEKGSTATSGEYKDFYDSIQEAEAACELRMVGQWQQHMNKDWRAIAEFMGRRYFDRWGKRERNDINQQIEGELEVKVYEIDLGGELAGDS